MSRRPPLLLALCTLLWGCGARTNLLEDRTVDGGSRPGAEAGVPDDAEAGLPTDASLPDGPAPPELRVTTPVIVFDGAAEGLDLQRFGQLVWTGDKYATIACENEGGHVVAVMRFIDATGKVDPSRYPISEVAAPLADSPESTWLAWTGSDFAAFWTTSGRILMRRVDADGAPTTPPALALEDLGTNAYLVGGVTGDGLHALAWIDDRWETYAYLPYFARVSFDGVLVGESSALTSGVERVHTVGGFARQGGGYALLWNQREAGGTDRVYLSGYDTTGVAVGEPTQVYEADDALLAYQGPALVADADAWRVALWDLDRGALVQRWSGGVVDEHVVGQDARGHVEIGAHAGGVGGVLYGRGEWTDANPLPTELAFVLTEPGGGAIGGPIGVNVSPAGGQSCLEAYTLVPDDTGFGLLWAEGCKGARTVYFSRVVLP